MIHWLLDRKYPLLLLLISFLYLSTLLFLRLTANCSGLYSPDASYACPGYHEKDFGLEPDSYSYLETVKVFVGDSSNVSLILQPAFKPQRPLYPLLSSIFYHFNPNPSSLLVIPFVSAIISPAVIYLCFLELKLPKKWAFLGALFFLFSTNFSLYATKALGETLSLLFGFGSFYVWSLNHRKKTSDFFTGFIFSLSILARETNAVFLLSALLFDVLNGNLKKKGWYKLPVILLVLLIPLYVSMLNYGLVEYPSALKALKIELLSPLFRIFLSLKDLFKMGGLLSICGILGMTKIVFPLKKEDPALVLVFVLLSNALVIHIWGFVATRFWLLAIPVFIYFALYWLKSRISEMQLSFLLFFLVLFDPVYSPSGWAIFSVLRSLFTQYLTQ